MRKGRKDVDNFTIGNLSRHTGVNVETIRYYERIRLMPRPPRTAGGHRAYGTDHLQTLTFIRRSRELGFRLDDIRALLALRGPQACCLDVKAIADRHLEIVRTRMRDLADLESSLAAMVDRCAGDRRPECAVLEVLETDSVVERKPSA